jgi:hypothetical protein
VVVPEASESVQTAQPSVFVRRTLCSSFSGSARVSASVTGLGEMRMALESVRSRMLVRGVEIVKLVDVM